MPLVKHKGQRHWLKKTTQESRLKTFESLSVTQKRKKVYFFFNFFPYTSTSSHSHFLSFLTWEWRWEMRLSPSIISVLLNCGFLFVVHKNPQIHIILSTKIHTQRFSLPYKTTILLNSLNYARYVHELHENGISFIMYIIPYELRIIIIVWKTFPNQKKTDKSWTHGNYTERTRMEWDEYSICFTHVPWVFL